MRAGLNVNSYQGTRVEKLDIAEDFPWLDPQSQQARDLERFQWFSNGYVAKGKPENSVIDIRYSMLPNEIDPLWGIQLSPNCSRVLHHLGLQESLKQFGFLPEGTQLRHWKTSAILSESKLGDAATLQFGAPYYHIHRGDLLRLLVDAASQQQNISLHLSCNIENFSQNDHGVLVEANNQSFKGDLLIGADGIHSKIRASLWGDESPRFTGNIAWRAVVPTHLLAPGIVKPMSTAWLGPHKHFVHYYVKGGEFVNCVCVVEKKGWQTESWTEPGNLSELKSDFHGWHNNIQQLIDNIDEAQLFKWALHDRRPMTQWAKRRVTLLGDACHPTLPFMAQGAAMAIEDSMVIADCLSVDTSVNLSLIHI